MTNTFHAGSAVTHRMALVENGAAVTDLNGATLDVRFIRPDETAFAVVGSFYGPDTDGIAEYVGSVGEFDMVGSWRWQVHVTNGSDEWFSDMADFEILANIAIV